MMIDTHCHPQLKQYDRDRDEVIRRALDVGVQMICVGVDLETSGQAIELAERYQGLWASVGLHPNDNLEEKYNQNLYESLAQHGKVVAIGEVGLDYYRTTNLDKQKFQKERFLQQLELAQKINKPLVIHCREAHDDMLELLPNFRGVIHSFTGTPEQAREYTERGFYLGLNGIITFTEDYDQMIKELPLDKILLETDAPYLAPVPYRGKRNEPSKITQVAEHLARLRGVTLEDVSIQTSKNAKELFGLQL